MRVLPVVLSIVFSGYAVAAETSLICEYGEKEETRLLRFDEAAGTLRYKGETWIDRSKHNTRTADGWAVPISVRFTPTEIKMTFYTCTTQSEFGYGGCKNQQVYTLDRTTGTLTAEPINKFFVKVDTAIMQCRLADTVPLF